MLACVTSNDMPTYGYGRGRRPLWTERDEAAEQIRAVLRSAGHRERGKPWGGKSKPGFVVEGGEPFHVACAGYGANIVAEQRQYAEALRTAGYVVEGADDTDRQDVLVVWTANPDALHA